LSSAKENAVVEVEASSQNSETSERWLGNHRSAKVSELLAREILTDIGRRNLQPGAKLLAEAAMLEQYGVGRASLREALRILEIYGIIKIKPGPGGGPVVDSVDNKDFGSAASFYFNVLDATVGDLLEARAALEPFMARIAAERITPERADAMRAVIELEGEAVADPAAEWGRASAGFHAEVAGLTGNPILDLVGRTLTTMLAERTRPIFPPGERGPTRKIHRRIAEAIISGEADEAERLSERHVKALNAKIVELFPHLLEEQIDWR
jgi:GntR family transcriptional repressor for pyruvate dehydrogenase complex